MGYTTACQLVATLADSEDSGADHLVDALRRRMVCLDYTDIAADGVGIASYGPLPRDVRIVGAKVLPRKAATAHDTNYATVVLGSDDGAGAGAVAIQTLTTKITGGTGNLVAGTAVNLADAKPSVTVAAGRYLTLTVTKAAAGVAVDLRVCVDLRYEGA